MKHLALKTVALAAALASQLAPLCAHAQTPATPAAAPEAGAASPAAGSGLSVVVTGRPIVEANQVDAYGSYSTRLVESQVQALSALDLTAALRMTPGVQISRYDEVGSYNGNQGGAVYIRGLGASRPGSEIKTYVDGVPVYMGVWNHPLLDLLPVHAMQSITVMKGPQPQWSGNNFASIELETQRARDAGLHGEGQVAAGSFGNRVLQGQLLGRQDNASFTLAVGDVRSDGHVANADAHLRNALGRIEVNLDAQWSLGAGFLAVDNQAGDPKFASPAARNTSDAQMVNAWLGHRHDGLSGQIKVYTQRGHNDLANDAVWGNFDSSFQHSGLRWREELQLGSAGRLAGGVDIERVGGEIQGPWVGGGAPWTGATNGTAKLDALTSTSPYIAYDTRIALADGWSLQPSAGLRHHRVGDLASKTAPHAGVALSAGPVKVWANYAEGVLYPGLETRALPLAIAFMFAADTAADRLAPSTNRHKEVGASWSAPTGTRLDVTLFRDDIANRYVWTAPTGPYSGSFSNSYSDYHLQGSEIALQQSLPAGFQAFAGLTLLKSSIETQPYVPRTAWTLGVNGMVGPVKLVLDAQRQSGMYATSLDRDASATTQKVDGFTVANARLSYPLPALGRKGEVYLAANNLFDTEYEYNPGYTMPGRNWRLGLMASF